MEHGHHEISMFGCLRGLAASALVIAALAAAIIFAFERRPPMEIGPVGFGGDPERGQALVVRYGCPACHLIPGVAPRGMVGPSLAGLGSRSIIAGRFANRPIDLELWIQYPQEMKPGSAMPDVGVGQRDARDIAAFLARLK